MGESDEAEDSAMEAAADVEERTAAVTGAVVAEGDWLSAADGTLGRLPIVRPHSRAPLPPRSRLPHTRPTHASDCCDTLTTTRSPRQRCVRLTVS